MISDCEWYLRFVQSIVARISSCFSFRSYFWTWNFSLSYSVRIPVWKHPEFCVHLKHQAGYRCNRCIHIKAYSRKAQNDPFIVCGCNTLSNQILPSADRPGESLRLREKAVVLILNSKSECVFYGATVPELWRDRACHQSRCHSSVVIPFPREPLSREAASHTRHVQGRELDRSLQAAERFVARSSFLL